MRRAPFLDVSRQILTGGEGALLGLAFHPDCASNGKLHVHICNLAGDAEVLEHRVLAANPNVVDAGTRRGILSIDQPARYSSHNGGWMAFGPDGKLFIATGDGGGNDMVTLADGNDRAWGMAGNQAFAWIGTAAFSATGPQARYTVSGNETIVEFHTGHASTDLMIRLSGVLTLSATDLAL